MTEMRFIAFLRLRDQSSFLKPKTHGEQFPHTFTSYVRVRINARDFCSGETELKTLLNDCSLLNHEYDCTRTSSKGANAAKLTDQKAGQVDSRTFSCKVSLDDLDPHLSFLPSQIKRIFFQNAFLSGSFDCWERMFMRTGEIILGSRSVLHEGKQDAIINDRNDSLPFPCSEESIISHCHALQLGVDKNSCREIRRGDKTWEYPKTFAVTFGSGRCAKLPPASVRTLYSGLICESCFCKISVTLSD